MFNLTEDIARLLESHGFETEFQVCDCFDVIAVKVKDSYRRIMLHPVVADTMEKAEAEQARWDRAMQTLDDSGMLVLTEDRWHSQRKMMEARLLSHLEIFDQVYARNCEIRKIDKATVSRYMKSKLVTRYFHGNTWFINYDELEKDLLKKVRINSKLKTK